MQIDQVGNNVLAGEVRNRVTMNWDSSLSTGVPLTRGPFGYYSVRSNGVAPKQGFVTEGDISTTNIGLFIQDSWTIKNRLTINAGIRTERERVPTYTVGEDIPEFGLEFGFGEKLAPRIGAAYDLKGDGRTKVFGNWGVFYDIFKLELPRGSFGGDKWLEYYYTLDTPNWTTLVDGANCPPACPGTLIRGPIDFRHPSFGDDAIEPDLKPMRQQEASAGIEHQLNNFMAVSRPLRPQAGRPGDRRHGLPPAGRQRGVRDCEPGRRHHRARVHQPADEPSQGRARLRRDRNQVREAAVEQLVPQRRVHVEPAVRQLLGPDASRTRTAAPAPTSDASSTTRR